MNTLYVFGDIGLNYCYLNVPLQEAFERYKKQAVENGDYVCDDFQVHHFDDHFMAYAINDSKELDG